MMTKALTSNTIRFIFLVFSQIFIFNKIQVTGYINPQVYVLFILMLPFRISGFWLLFLSFMTGLAIDVFMQTPGLHASASVFMAFCRPGVIRLVGKKEDLEAYDCPNVRDSGPLWFFSYSIILVTLHHVFLFFMEVFRLSEFSQTLLKILINAILSTLIIMLIQYLFYSRKKE